MDLRTSTGLLGALTVAGVVALGVYGFADGYLLESAGEMLAPTVTVLAITTLVIVALIATGARSKRWLQNPYW